MTHLVLRPSLSKHLALALLLALGFVAGANIHSARADVSDGAMLTPAADPASFTTPTCTATPTVVLEEVYPGSGNLHIILRFPGGTKDECRPPMGLVLPAAGGSIVRDGDGGVIATMPANLQTDLTNLATDLASAITTAAAAGKFNP